MGSFETLQAEHLSLLDRLDTGTAEAPQPSIDAVRAYIEQARAASAHVAGPRERDQLRANLNFWGAYIYDHTNTYPDTALSPASRATDAPKTRWQSYRDLLTHISAQTVPGPWWRNPYYLLIGLVGVLIVALLVWGGWSIVENVLQSTPTVTATATLTPTIDTPPTSTSTPRSTQRATETPDPLIPTATAPPRRTSTPETPITPTPLPPMTRQQVVAIIKAAPAACDTRTLEVQVDDSALKVLGERGVSVQLSTPGGQLLASNSLTAQRETVTFGSAILSQQRGSTLLRLSNISGDVTATDVIIDFAEDCSRNALRVTYRLAEAPTVVEAPKSASNLTLDWELITWGPSPVGETWVAQLQLVARGVDTSALFWLDGQRLTGDVITVEAPACEAARHAIGVSSGGEVVLRELVLMSPYCP